MPKIRLLEQHVAELIAAGEVVERPSSVVKELMENAIDAGATSVTVEIERGGVQLIRVTDNGCGIAREDVPTAFLRHATSKVRTEDDLTSIHTLGFRGEALASICAVARVEMLTRTADELAGTDCVIEGGSEPEITDAGCPVGTTIFVRDLFYNVPARMKFLKKDVSEGNAVAAVADCLALSHPEVAVTLIREGRETLLTPGNGDERACIYAVFGRDFARDLLPVSYSLGGVRVTGFICRPTAARANRTMQHFFVNGRYVKTRTAAAALERAYQGAIMVGKFPACVLHLDMPPETVDANVHPAKIEVRFTNERPIFDAVFHAVKSALLAEDTPKQAVLHQKPAAMPEPRGEQVRFAAPKAATPPARTKTPSAPPATPAAPAAAATVPPTMAAGGFVSRPLNPSAASSSVESGGTLPLHDATVVLPPLDPDLLLRGSADVEVEVTPPVPQTAAEPETADTPPVVASDESGEAEEDIVYLGEAYRTYLIAEKGGSLFFIDKHAAHERILYNKLHAAARTDAQMLLAPVAVSLGREEYDVLLTSLDLLREAGFEAEDFDGALLVRSVPMLLTGEDVPALMQEIAAGLLSGRREIAVDKLSWIYHSVACRAAIKAGDRQSPLELEALARRVLTEDDIRYCPHGRPVCFELTRRELEKQFGRV